MQTITLPVAQRPKDSLAREVRADGKIPAVYYGAGKEAQHFMIDYQTFRRAYTQAGRSTILQLHGVSQEDLPALVHEIQYDPKTDAIIHVDFMAVDMNKTLYTQIPIKFTGVAPAVKDMAGILVHNKEVLEVSCLPKDLIHEIEVDVSPLVDFHASITVGDIQVPAGITILDAPDINVAIVSAPRVEEEPTAAAPAEGEEAGEGEETAEGEAGEKKEGEEDKKKEGEGK